MIQEICRQIGLVDTLDRMKEWDRDRCRLSPGKRITAMMINILYHDGLQSHLSIDLLRICLRQFIKCTPHGVVVEIRGQYLATKHIFDIHVRGEAGKVKQGLPIHQCTFCSSRVSLATSNWMTR